MAVVFSLFVLSSLIFSTEAQTRVSNISLGSSLSPTGNNSHWLSESGQFAFGFSPYGNGFSVGIWLENIRPRTVVWTANRDEPPFSSDVTLLLNAERGLVVQENQGGRVISIIANASFASSASMLDTGNFVLYDSSSEIIWQSFDSPTDTLLPSQRLSSRQRLVSGVSETNHTSGKFQIIMQRDGNLVQYPVGPREPDAAYWNITAAGEKNVTLNLDLNGRLYLLNDTGFVVKNITERVSVSRDGFHRATIDADGIFRLYSLHSNQSSNWSIQWSSSANKCDPKGLCGVNSYCTLMDTDPVCKCLTGFDFIDSARTNLGCRRNHTEDASTRKEQNFDVVELSSLSWEEDSYATFDSISKDDCREECRRDCNCEVAIYHSFRQVCKKLKLPLRYGRAGTGGRSTTFVKMPAGSRTISGEKVEKRELRMDIFITGIASLAIAFCVLAFSGVLIYRHRIRQYKRVMDQRDSKFVEDVTLKSFTYEELKSATNNFMDCIGKGGFGTVFRGVISNGKRIVAIKRLERVVADGERDFRNEMKAIGKTHHRNLVQLLGYCYDGTNRLLVYEYMKNGSLADFLFRSDLKINWDGRIAITLNIARGIFYLHEECHVQIIHCDIKPENILMDDKGHAKIADFGLAKLLMPNQSKTFTGIRGTRGYVAPEWHWNMPVTVKADVYSFGVMLFEIICCRRNMEVNVPDNEQVLVNWAYDCFKANEVQRLVPEDEVDRKKLERMVKVGLWCTQDEPSSRPTMKKVILMLEGTPQIPKPPNPATPTGVGGVSGDRMKRPPLAERPTHRPSSVMPLFVANHSNKPIDDFGVSHGVSRFSATKWWGKWS
ncbi:hypothetical protein like AT1G34300 [Hibiscus trionum]|uniref:Receptor-like serine/threonine-protein kinase n=1 Tax=Hibiscus trionum TaxID=183268 RepID=A0A9W7MRP7_HIBTR|nr:hypothetical protein like AT1G34300 [Hibiscus trionum]